MQDQLVNKFWIVTNFWQPAQKRYPGPREALVLIWRSRVQAIQVSKFSEGWYQRVRLHRDLGDDERRLESFPMPADTATVFNSLCPEAILRRSHKKNGNAARQVSHMLVIFSEHVTMGLA
jgi:hypothetical protein